MRLVCVTLLVDRLESSTLQLLWYCRFHVALGCVVSRVAVYHLSQSNLMTLTCHFKPVSFAFNFPLDFDEGTGLELRSMLLQSNHDKLVTIRLHFADE